MESENKKSIFTRIEDLNVAPEPAVTVSPDSPFYGTPWTNDEEIYDHVIRLRYEEEWDWEYIRQNLIDNGLEAYYADAILANTQSEGKKAKTTTRWRGVGELAAAIFLIIVAILVFSPGSGYHFRGRGIVALIIAPIYLLIDGCRHLTKKF